MRTMLVLIRTSHLSESMKYLAKWLDAGAFEGDAVPIRAYSAILVHMVPSALQGGYMCSYLRRPSCLDIMALHDKDLLLVWLF